VPLAVILNVAAVPGQSVWLPGCVLTEGAAFTVNVAVLDVAVRKHAPVSTQSKVLPFSPVTSDTESVTPVAPEYTPVLIILLLFLLHW
jgi:hypothetical protein